MTASEGPAAVPPPLVSVIVRTKDRPVLLRRALATLSAQSYAPIEAVVVNDGGCDLDAEMLRSTLGSVALEYVRLAERSGRAHAANSGIAAAHGALIGFLDDDDELLPAHVGTLVAAQAASGADVVYSDCELVERQLGAEGQVLRESSDGRFFMSRDFSAAELCFENFIPLLCVLVRREVFGAAGGFDEQFELYEDWDFFVRAARHARFHHVGEVTARYVQWSRESQIAFAGGDVGRQAYERVMAKHWQRAAPGALYDFLGVLHEERRRLHRRIAALERSEPALAQALSDLDRAHAEVRENEAERAALRQQVAAHRADIERLGFEIERGERALERVRADADGEIARLRSRVAEITRAVQASLAWRVIERYRLGKERMLPAGSRRRRLYDRLLGTGDYRLLHASASRGVGATQPSQHRPVRETFLPPAIATATEDVLGAKVSVIIPTLNAGTEFRAVLERLRTQRGLPDLEIIAVDSGSTDGTLALCERHRVKVLPYPEREFNHGLARNVGAAAATGDFLVFLSQDAIPVGERAVASMVRVLQADRRLAAASARQLPRSDADLFTCWQLWAYRLKVLGYTRDTVVSVDPQRLSTLAAEERRRAAQIDNVFACVRRDAFDRLRFRTLPIAEDLDLGLRLLDQEYKIAFLSSVAVTHSHNRQPSYHLRRAFMEWNAMVDLLGFETLPWLAPHLPSMGEAVRAAYSLYRGVGQAVASECRKSVAWDVRPAQSIIAVRALLEAPDAGADAERDESIESVLRELAASLQIEEPEASLCKLEPFTKVYLDALGSFGDYLASASLPARDDAELSTALFKLCADVIGRCLSDYSIWLSRRRPSDPGPSRLLAVMRSGV